MFTIFRREFLAKLPHLIIPKRVSPSKLPNSLLSAHLIHMQPKRTSNKDEKSTVTLIGSVHSRVKQTGKVRQFFFKTTNPSAISGYAVHNIWVNNHDCEHYGLENLEIGDRLLIFGDLRAQKFEMENGKGGQATRIKAFRAYKQNTQFSPENLANQFTNPDLSMLDLNRVTLSGQISFDLKHFEDKVVFHLAHNFPIPLDNGSYGEGVLFVSVFVTEEPLLEYVRGLQRLDYVELKGNLGYHLRMDKDGRKRYNGFILAESLSKSIRLAQRNEKEEIE